MKNEIVVLIPHYNDAEGLERSVLSISKEESVDLLIIDDGSRQCEIIEEKIRNNFKANGAIIFLNLKKNGGITQALNCGLEYIRTKHYQYIARLDAGDICLDNRFKIQVDFLKKNPNIKLVGSNVIVKDHKGNFLYEITVPTDSNKIKNRMYISSSTVIHPTIMFKKEIVDKVGLYPEEYEAAEDYAYYFKILKEFEISNINSFLLEKELNPDSISIRKRKVQSLSRVRVILDNFYFGFYPVYGFIRNYILYLVPNKIIIQIKKVILK